MQDKLKPYFREHIVTAWIIKWGPKIVLSTIRFFFNILKSQKQPIQKPEAWMESAFKNNFAELDETSRENKAFAEKLKKEYGLVSLKINKRYCQDTARGKDYYYYLPCETFQKAIQQLAESDQ